MKERRAIIAGPPGRREIAPLLTVPLSAPWGDQPYDLDEIIDEVDPDWLSWLAIWAMFD